MSGRSGRERPRRDNHSPRHSSSLSKRDERPLARMKNPPSRHLWVGNLAHDVAQSTLVDHFYRFGELESVAFQQGRSFAFVNYMREDDAIAALKSLQGFTVAGLPLRIEFAKSDKSSTYRDDSNFQHRDELKPPSRRSVFSPRESVVRHGSDAFYPDNFRESDNSEDHPSEILWIGFPSFLKVDEKILWKQFSPFGDIEKITVPQGRTYAFVQFRTIASASKAKATLQGKLFGNPRVQICFSRSDKSSNSAGRRDMDPKISSSPHFNPNGQPRSPDRFRTDRHFATLSEDPSMRPPHFLDMEHADTSFRSFSRKEPSLARTHDACLERRVHDLGPDVDLLQGQPYCRSPGRDGNARFTPRELTRKSRFPEDEWGLPDDTFSFREPKKTRTDSFSHEKELRDDPFHNADPGKLGILRMASDFPHTDDVGAALPFRRLPGHPFSVNPSSVDRHDNWKPSHDTYQLPLSPFSSNTVDWKRNNLELRKPGIKEVWKWEGTIAKGGTPVCQARCFPVGKVMDLILPEILDCTARTGLAMLAKHYYEAANSWVVFFVAASDADMGYYNEFMHYLGDKQRAAVVKLDERNTLFLVPPSEFSENVLKVPGKLSISGVVLSLEPSSLSVASVPPGNETHMYAHVDTSFHRVEQPSSPFPPSAYLLSTGLAASRSLSSVENMTTSAASLMPACDHGTESVSDQGGYWNQSQTNSHASTVGSTWPPQPPPTTSGPSRDFTSHSFSVSQDYQHPIPGRYGSEPSGGTYNYGGTGISYSGGNNTALHAHHLPTSITLPQGGLRPDQQAQLVSSLLAQHNQSANASFQATPERYRPSESVGYHPESQTGLLPNHYTGTLVTQLPSDLSSPFSQMQQPQHAENMQALSVAGGSGGAQDEDEADPQKRLQATLQLAAALLQQIQQGKGT